MKLDGQRQSGSEESSPTGGGGVWPVKNKGGILNQRQN